MNILLERWKWKIPIYIMAIKTTSGNQVKNHVTVMRIITKKLSGSSIQGISKMLVKNSVNFSKTAKKTFLLYFLYFRCYSPKILPVGASYW